jgi:hypothetical protein
MTVIHNNGFSPTYYAEIRDVRDPDKTGKFLVCVHGLDNVKGVVDQSLMRWAHTNMGDSTAMNGVGKTIYYAPGTTVYGKFTDYPTNQIFVIEGSLNKKGESAA